MGACSTKFQSESSVPLNNNDCADMSKIAPINHIQNQQEDIK